MTMHVEPPSEGERSAAHSSPELRGILDAVDVPIAVIGRDCALVRFNRAAVDVLGVAPSDVGLSVDKVAAFADVSDLAALCMQVIDDETPQRRDVRSGDRRFLLRASPYVADGGRTTGVVLTFTNVTAFRASIEQAIYEREYTKAILNTVSNPLVVVDGTLRVLSGNRAFYAMVGLSRDQSHGVPLHNLGDDRWRTAAFWDSARAVLSEGDAFAPVEIERDFSGVGRRTVLMDARRVDRDGAGTILLAIQDITDRKRAEEQLQDAHRRKDEFLALLAHELRNPLAPIRTGLELVRLSGDTPQSVARVRQIMERQIKQMVRLVDDLLDVARIASGKIVLQLAATSLNDLVRNAVESQRAAMEAAHVDFHLEMPNEVVSVNVDPARFLQIVSNVLHNAAKFTPADGVVRCAVELRTVADSRLVAITISDTGSGISPEMLPRVFEMFIQADGVAERKGGGLGIGLALARRLVEMHGGTIAAHSGGLGHGSTFTITVPVCEEPVAQPARPRVDVERVACRALIVDDNRDAAETMRMLVEQLGGSACVAHEAIGCLDAAAQFQPDIVLLDIGLPGIDGYEACRRLRQFPWEKPLMILALTGWGQPQDKQRALDAGFDAHLTKPVDPLALEHLLAAVAPMGPGA